MFVFFERCKFTVNGQMVLLIPYKCELGHFLCKYSCTSPCEIPPRVSFYSYKDNRSSELVLSFNIQDITFLSGLEAEEGSNLKNTDLQAVCRMRFERFEQSCITCDSETHFQLESNVS